MNIVDTSLFFYYRKGKKAAAASRKIITVYEKDGLMELMCQKCFSKCRSGKFSAQDALCLNLSGQLRLTSIPTPIIRAE